MGVPGCYPGRGRFESFPRRSNPLVPCSHAPGVSVGEGRQPFELEARGSIPLGSTRGLAMIALSRVGHRGQAWICGAVTVSVPQRVVVEVVRSFARKAHQRES